MHQAPIFSFLPSQENTLSLAFIWQYQNFIFSQYKNPRLRSVEDSLSCYIFLKSSFLRFQDPSLNTTPLMSLPYATLA